jgi:hypothetical protein
MKACISLNGRKNVMNYIMGSHTFIAMGITQEVDTHRVNAVCAYPLGEAYN